MFILSVLNTQFRAILKRFGINATGGEIWFDAPDTDWSKVQTKWNVISSVAQRVPVDDDYIYEETGIPKPDNYDQMKQEQEERRQMIQQQISEKQREQEDTRDQETKKKLVARIADFFGVAPTRFGADWNTRK
ncbi:MAG TPA: hypothetical protein PKW49_03370 [Paludibacteraceae bacterium]|nr:hypothetical protein [Paludibacteraceae bacterium]HQK35609.1 hypothetical protein [Spirochaetales bacterium]